MRKALDFILKFISVPGDVDAFTKWVASILGVAVMNGLWGAVAYGAPMGIFIASGMVAFGAVAYRALSLSKQDARLEEQVALTGHLLQGMMVACAPDQRPLKVMIQFKNHGSVPITLQFVDEDCSIGDDRVRNSNPDKSKAIIGPHAEIWVSTDVMKPSYQTVLTRDAVCQIEVLYWRSGESQRCRMRAKTEFNMKNCDTIPLTGFFHHSLPWRLVGLEYKVEARPAE